MMDGAPFLVAEDIAKSYGGAQALRGVTVALHAGEVHGLVGANGAGKSTLIRILAGVTGPDSGRILLDGRPVAIPSPHHAADLGMSFIHQELAFVPGMSVIQNIMLGLPKKTRFGMIDWAAIAHEVAPVAKRVGLGAPLFAGVKGLSTAENWLISICRALIRRARLIVMDEPTASLSAGEAEKLFRIIADLTRSGVGVLYVSHRLDEIKRLCTRVTALRDGRTVAHLRGGQITRGALVGAIVGTSAEAQARAQPAPRTGGVVLSVDGLARLPRVRGVSFVLRRGEVLGLGGLVGAGRSEVARLIYGADRPDSGTMTLHGQPFAPASPAAAVRAGLGLVPEERRTEALLLHRSIAFNLQLANLASLRRGPLLDGGRRTRLALGVIRDLAIKAQGPDLPVARLSGGNQQKVAIGRWLLRAPDVLILDEPTRGVDIGARSEIHRHVRALAARGMAVLVISSEPEELPDLCDRVLVMAEGRVVLELCGAGLTRNAVVAASYAEAPAHGVSA